MFQLNAVYNLDCMEGMKEIHDNYFDLAIVDPPYGIGDFLMHYGAGVYKPHSPIERRYAGAHTDWNNEIPASKYFDELRRVSKDQVIWGANYYNCFSANGGALVWWKNTGHTSLSQCEIASVSKQKKVDYFAFKPLNGFLRKEERIHPCQKPIEVYKYCLQNYAKEGDKILDTHVGSGSSIIACIDMGFDYMGFEIDADYYAAMQNRIYHFTRQQKLAI